MQEKSLIKKNILQYIEYKGVSKYEFYKNTRITRGILDQNNGISEENITRFLAYYKEVNVEWLILGTGKMLKEDEPLLNKDNIDNDSNYKDKYLDVLEENRELRKKNENLLKKQKNTNDALHEVQM